MARTTKSWIAPSTPKVVSELSALIKDQLSSTAYEFTLREPWIVNLIRVHVSPMTHHSDGVTMITLSFALEITADGGGSTSNPTPSLTTSRT